MSNGPRTTRIGGHVGCLVCKTVVGVINEVQDEKRPEVWRNECVPNPMPRNCAKCGEILVRVV